MKEQKIGDVISAYQFITKLMRTRPDLRSEDTFVKLVEFYKSVKTNKVQTSSIKMMVDNQEYIIPLDVNNKDGMIRALLIKHLTEKFIEKNPNIIKQK